MQNINHISKQSEFDRIWALFQETREQIKETSTQLKETDRVLSEKFRETDEKFKETDKMLSEKFKRTEKLIGKLTNNWGEFVEGIVRPSVIKIFNERSINIERIANRETSHKGGETMEIDILGHNGDYVVAIEVKTKLLSYDVIDFTKRLKRFGYFFPEYADKKLVGAVAGITVDYSVKRLAEKKKLFIIIQKGDTVEIINPQDFKPKIW